MTAHAHLAGPNTIATEDGAHLFYRDWPGSHTQARPVLFVGGWSMPSASWGYQMMALHQRGLRCIAFDRRGHGRSSDPGGGYDFDTLAGDIGAVIEGAAHGMFVTHVERVNAELLEFISGPGYIERD